MPRAGDTVINLREKLENETRLRLDAFRQMHEQKQAVAELVSAAEWALRFLDDHWYVLEESRVVPIIDYEKRRELAEVINKLKTEGGE